MKNCLFILGLFISFGLCDLKSQSTTASFFNDTAVNTTASIQQVGTLTYPHYYSVTVVTDSLTGSTDGTVYLQHLAQPKSGTPAYDTANWVTLGSFTLNGATQQTQLWYPGYSGLPGYLLDGKLRVKIVGVGTQTTRIRTTISRIRKTL